MTKSATLLPSAVNLSLKQVIPFAPESVQIIERKVYTTHGWKSRLEASSAVSKENLKTFKASEILKNDNIPLTATTRTVEFARLEVPGFQTLSRMSKIDHATAHRKEIVSLGTP